MRATKSKLLAFVLSAAMVLALPGTVFAADVSVPETSACILTEGCTLTEGHEGECILVPQKEDDIPEVCTQTEGCVLEAGHEGECRTEDAADVGEAFQACTLTDSCVLEADHDGACVTKVGLEESETEESDASAHKVCTKTENCMLDEGHEGACITAEENRLAASLLTNDGVTNALPATDNPSVDGTVSTEAELTAAISNNVQEITLADNIYLNATIELKAPKTFTINGNGYTIDGKKKLLKVSAGSNVTLNNVTLKTTSGSALDVVQGKVTMNGTVNLSGGAFSAALTINGGYATPAEVVVNGNLTITAGALGSSVDMSGGNSVLMFGEDASVSAKKFTPKGGKVINNSEQVVLSSIMNTGNVEVIDNTIPTILRAWLNAKDNRISVDLKTINFSESVQLKLYSNDTLLTTASLNTTTVTPGSYPDLTGAISFDGSSSSWPRTDWQASDATVPTKIELWIDGEVKASTDEFYTGSADLGHLMQAEDWYNFPGTVCVYDRQENDDGFWMECACGKTTDKIVHAYLNDTSTLGSHISVNMENVTFEDSIALKVYTANGELLTITDLDTAQVPTGTYTEFTGFIAVGGEDTPWSKDAGWAKHDKIPAIVELIVDGEAVSTHKIYNDITDKFGSVLTPEDWYTFDGTECVYDETKWEKNETEHWHPCVCGEKPDNATPHQFETVNAKEATCTEAGYTGDIVCTDCDYVKNMGEEIEPLSHDLQHSFGEWTVTKEPTETAKGEEERVCSVCGKIEKREIPVLIHTHNYGEDWKFDADNHWRECDCGEKADVAAHTYGDWTITKAATATEMGSREKSCMVCGYKVTENIPATGTITTPTATPNPTVTPEPTPAPTTEATPTPVPEGANPTVMPEDESSKGPQTGDTNQLLLWAGLFTVTGAGLLSALFYKLKGKNSK